MHFGGKPGKELMMSRTKGLVVRQSSFGLLRIFYFDLDVCGGLFRSYFPLFLDVAFYNLFKI